MANKFLNALTAGLEQLEISMTKQQLEQCVKYNQLLSDWNQKINLTAIKEPEEIAIKHFLDSLLLIKWLIFKDDLLLLDLGTGAGFPGLVLKIVTPEMAVTLVDTVKKKVDFVSLAAKELGLVQVKTIHARAEDLGRDFSYRGRFPVVTARAVAPLAVLAEYGLPLLRPRGRLYALKGPNYQGELEEAHAAISLLGGEVEKAVSYQLPLTGDQRSLLIISKNKETPKDYPRKSGTPAKKPLAEK